MLDIPAYFKYALELLLTPNGILSVLGIAGVAWLGRAYLKKIEIPGVTVEFVKDHSWFIHRDDNHRLSAVISLKITNKGGQEARVKSVKFSGYSPVQEALPILLESRQNSLPLPYPEGDQYFAELDYRIAPFSTQTVWLLYQSKSVDLRNRMSAPLVIRSEDGKRTAIRVEIYRHPYQVALYRQQWV